MTADTNESHRNKDSDKNPLTTRMCINMIWLLAKYQDTRTSGHWINSNLVLSVAEFQLTYFLSLNGGFPTNVSCILSRVCIDSFFFILRYA